MSSVPTALSANTLTRTGYTFASWNTAAIGSGIPHFEGNGDRTVDDGCDLFTAPERMVRCKH